MTSTPPFTSYPSPSFVRPRRPNPGLRAAGTVQLVVAATAFAGYFLLGVGVAMCSDGGSRAFCGRVDTHYLLAGCVIAANGVVGLVTLVAAQRPRRIATRRILGAGVAVGLILLVVTGIDLWTVVSAPIS